VNASVHERLVIVFGDFYIRGSTNDEHTIDTLPCGEKRVFRSEVAVGGCKAVLCIEELGSEHTDCWVSLAALPTVVLSGGG
jgi:hypothetical protein